MDVGSADDTVFGERIETEVDGLSLSAVGFPPVGPVDLFALVGAIKWDGETRSPTLGRGGDDDTDLDTMSLGVTWTFFQRSPETAARHGRAAWTGNCFYREG